MDRRAPVAVEADRPDRRADVRRSLGGAVPRLAQAPQACDPAPVLVHEPGRQRDDARSEEHTSELQSLMRISYAVFCLKKKQHHNYIYLYMHQNNNNYSSIP